MYDEGKASRHCCFSKEVLLMFRNAKAQTVMVLAAGMLFGYAAAAGKLDVFRRANAAPSEPSVNVKPEKDAGLSCCTDGLTKGQMVAMADPKVQTTVARAEAQTGKKPNILFIMGDDIGWMQPQCYHRGLMVGETPNIDPNCRGRPRLLHGLRRHAELHLRAQCLRHRHAYPLRTGMIPPQLPGSPSYLQPGTPCIAQFLLDLGYTTGQFGKNHLGDHPASLPTAHGFQEYWGYLYHLDAMQQVSFPDINKSPLVQGVAPPMKVEPIPGIPDAPGAIDPKDGVCLAAPRPVLWMKSPDGTAKRTKRARTKKAR